MRINDHPQPTYSRRWPSALGVIVIFTLLLGTPTPPMGDASGSIEAPAKAGSPDLPANPVSPATVPERCLPPCWRGIVPGKSTEAEAQIILSQLPMYYRMSWADNGNTVVEHTWGNRSSCMPGDNDNYLRSINGVVQEISLSYDAASIRLGEIVDTYGPPISLVSAPSASMIWFPRYRCSIIRGVFIFIPGTGTPSTITPG